MRCCKFYKKVYGLGFRVRSIGQNMYTHRSRKAGPCKIV